MISRQIVLPALPNWPSLLDLLDLLNLLNLLNLPKAFQLHDLLTANFPGEWLNR